MWQAGTTGVTRMGPRTRGNSGVKAPHMMVLSEGFFLGVLSREGGDGAPISSSERRCPYKELRVSAPRPPKLADTSTDTDRQMGQRWSASSSVPRGILRRCGWSGLLRLGQGL